jgi:hypothetical protein
MVVGAFRMDNCRSNPRGQRNIRPIDKASPNSFEMSTLRSMSLLFSGLEQMIKHHPARNQRVRPKTGVGGG